MPVELIPLIAYALALLVLSTFGANRYVLVSMFRRRQHHELRDPLPDAGAPRVTIQLPIYNELYVVERLIRSACEVDYPRDRLEVQVLDDSTDETLALARRLVRRWRKRGIDIVHIHRDDRAGFKGGALENGLGVAKGEFVAVFDADFVIPRDFLRRTVPHFDAPEVGMVQTRWSYLNDRLSLLTRAAALGLDGHFVVEQSARYWGGLFLNFNGTAGIWRAACIRDAGNWQHDTLTEDLDLSYRAQLAGWRFKYLWDVTCDSEIPADIYGMKAQQFRWTKGSMEAARKLLPRVWRAELPRWIKIQSTLHLLGNIVFPFFLLAGILNLPVVVVASQTGYDRYLFPLSVYFLFTFLGTFSYYWHAQRAVHLDWRRRVTYFPLFMGASIGLGVYNTQAALEGLLGRKSPFLRTPKYSLTSRNRSWRDKRYRSPMTWSTVGEVVLALYTIFTIGLAVHLGAFGALPFLCLFGFGYTMVASYSLKHMLLSSRARTLAKSTSGAFTKPQPALALAESPGSGVGREPRVPLAVLAGGGGHGGPLGAPALRTVNGSGARPARALSRERMPAQGAAVRPAGAIGTRVVAPKGVREARVNGPRSSTANVAGQPPADAARAPAANAARNAAGDGRRTSSRIGLLVLALLFLAACGTSGEERVAEPAELAQAQRLGFPPARPAGFEELPLVQRGEAQRVVTREEGGAVGGLWYRPRGSVFEWYVWADGLSPLRAYRLLFTVDGTSYAVASLWSDRTGMVRGYGSLEEFREGVCVSRGDFDAPAAVEGGHEIQVWIQDDGSKPSWTRSGGTAVPTTETGERLPCVGNGDESWDLRLVDVAPIRFEGV